MVNLDKLLQEVSEQYFNGQLRALSIRFSDGKWAKLLGKYIVDREIIISRSLKNESHIRYVIFILGIHAWLRLMGYPDHKSAQFWRIEARYKELPWLERGPLLKGFDRCYYRVLG